MKNLNLKNYEVSEISQLDASKTNGGYWQIIVAGILLDAMIHPGETLAELEAGWDAARQ